MGERQRKRETAGNWDPAVSLFACMESVVVLAEVEPVSANQLSNLLKC